MTPATLFVLLFAALQPPDPLVVRDAWVRQTSDTRTVSSGYVRIDNRTAAPVVLRRVVVDGARRAELHALVEENGRTVMKPMAALSIPARSSVTLAPGGTHVMITDVVRPFRIGAPVRMTFTFDNGQTRVVRAVVRPLDALSIK